jgi:hypothetical protein
LSTAQAKTKIAIPDKNTSSFKSVNITLGGLIIEGTDSPSTIKVVDLQGPTIEKSYAGKGIIRGGINVTYIGTLTSTTRPGGVFYSEGKAIIYANDGEIATHASQGIGYYGSDGKIHNHGSTFFNTTSTRKLAFLNNLIGVWADEIDPKTGIAQEKTWELK